MSVEERDPHSGYKTTGHEWNGIKELNTPVPRPVWFFLISAVLFSVVYWVLMPAWPMGRTFTKGLLGVDQRATVEQSVARAEAARADWTGALETTPFETALADVVLMARVRDTAPALFADNCAVCHGAGGQGARGYPSLRDDVWVWGGAPETIAETIRVGVNSGHPDTRISQMAAYGRDRMLPQEDVRAVVSYVRALSAERPPPPSRTLTRGAEVFSATCATCHGERGEGNQSVGAPDLTDDEWLYAGDPDTVFETVWHGRQGQMPAWERRLSLAQRRMLTLYLLDLQRSEP